MATATWNGAVIAESDDTVVVEGNHYFPLRAVRVELRPIAKTTVCPWKGTARYYDVVVDGAVNPGGAWTLPAPSAAAAALAGRVAFWQGVVVTG